MADYSRQLTETISPIAEYTGSFLPPILIGAESWNILHYRGDTSKSFDNDTIVNIQVIKPVTKGIGSFIITVENEPIQDIVEEDIFIISLGHEETNIKVLSGPIIKAKSSITLEERYKILEGVGWGVVLLENKTYQISYSDTEAADIVKDLVKDIVSDSPSISERKITTNYVENTGISISISFNDGETLYDCIQEIANSVDYDFYIDPDKNLHFFKRGSRNSGYLIEDTHFDTCGQEIEEMIYYESTEEIINKVTVIGKKVGADYPSDQDKWTEYTDPEANGWSKDAGTTIDTPAGVIGIRCVRGSKDVQVLDMELAFNIPESPLDCSEENYDRYTEWVNIPNLELEMRMEKDSSNYYKQTWLIESAWRKRDLELDTASWTSVGSPSWTQINSIRWIFTYYNAKFDTGKFDISRFDKGTGFKDNGNFMKNSLDGIYFTGEQHKITKQDDTSISTYDLRPKMFYDETIIHRDHASRLADAILRDYAYPRVIVESLMIEGNEYLDEGKLIWIKTYETDKLLRMVEINHQITDEGFYTNLTVGNPPRVTGTTLKELETEVETIERGE